MKIRKKASDMFQEKMVCITTIIPTGLTCFRTSRLGPIGYLSSCCPIITGYDLQVTSKIWLKMNQEHLNGECETCVRERLR